MIQLFMEALPDKLFDKLDTHRLPSLDQVLIEILDACGQNSATFERLAEIIGTDSAMTVRILTIVNSPGYFLIRPVTTLQSALINVGIDAIKTLAITTSLRKVLNGFNVGAEFDSRRYWKKSLFCGLMVKEMAGLAGYEKTDDACLAGLLHNVGELVIASNFPVEFRYCRALDVNEMLNFEQKQFGFNHFAVGAWVVRQWHLHPFISDAIFYQQEPAEHIFDSHILVRLLFLAIQLNPSEAIPDRTRFDLAERMFGFSSSMIRNLIEKVNDSMTKIAQSMSIELPEPESETSARSPGPEVPDAELPFWPEENSNRLAGLIRDEALAECVNSLLTGADDRRAFLNAIQVCAYVLFGCKRTSLFVLALEKTSLTGFFAGEERDPTSQITVSLRDLHSGIACAFRQNAATKSLVHSQSSPISIVDRQIARLFATDGIYCVPVPRSGQVAAVLVLGVAETRVGQLNKNPRLFREFVAMIGRNLNRVSNFCERKPESAPSVEDLRVQVRNLVHEANNPLTVLKNYLAILAKKLPGSYQGEIRIVRDEIERIGRLIRQISEEARVDQEEIDVNELIGDLLKIYRESYFIPQRIEVKFMPDRNMARIKTNADAIKQILTNLFKNSIEAMAESGKITIRSKWDVAGGAKKYVEILVADDGPGIPSEILSHLFEQPVSTKSTGHGFGLVIVKNLLRQMGGLIRVKAHPPKGVIFQILIPVEKRP